MTLYAGAPPGNSSSGGTAFSIFTDGQLRKMLGEGRIAKSEYSAETARRNAAAERQNALQSGEKRAVRTEEPDSPEAWAQNEPGGQKIPAAGLVLSARMRFADQ